jgi:hypothetical protein
MTPALVCGVYQPVGEAYRPGHQARVTYPEPGARPLRRAVQFGLQAGPNEGGGVGLAASEIRRQAERELLQSGRDELEVLADRRLGHAGPRSFTIPLRGLRGATMAPGRRLAAPGGARSALARFWAHLFVVAA